MPNVAGEWKRGWRTVASSSVGALFMAGIPSVTGVVMAPLMAEFGWSRSVITASMMICAVMSLVLAPVLGRLITRFGARRCALTSVLAMIPSLLLVASTGGSAWTWIGAWIILSVIFVGVGMLMWTGLVAELFDRGRGTAFAITLSGTGLAYFIFPPFAVLMLQNFGWRGVYVGIAALYLTVLFPLIFAWFRGLNDLNGRSSTSASTMAPLLTGFSLNQALGNRQFWQFGLLSFLLALGEGALVVHLFPILNEGGIDTVMAAWVTSLIGISMIVGRLLTGFLLDRFPPLPIFSGAIVCILVSCVLARAFAGNVGLGVVIALFLGLGAGGTTNALAYLTSRYFGLVAYPSIFGLLMGFFSVGYGIAPVIAGHLREGATSYAPIFDTLIVALVVATLLTITLGRPKPNPI